MSDQGRRTFLAIGAHAGDIEVACAAVLAKHAAGGDRVVILHLTPGEGGNPKLSPRLYGEQKKREALAAGRAVGAEVLFGPYKDGELPDNEETRRYVAEQIRSVKPSHIITHWKHSIHRDHAAAHAVVMDGILLASLESVVTSSPRHRGITGVYFTENWEDPEAFSPFLYVDVSSTLSAWRECVSQYEFIRGGISSFPYLDYYEALARVRGAEAGTRYAVAFGVDPFDRKKIVDLIP